MKQSEERAFWRALWRVASFRAGAGIRRRLGEAWGRVQPFTLVLSCIGLLLAYLVGVYVTGPLHAESRWMGAMLACTSVVGIVQKPDYRESLKTGWVRVFGTFLGAVIAYIYLVLFPFSVVGMLAAVAVLMTLCMLLNIYNNAYMATLTLLIIILISQMTPEISPERNCMLRFAEAAIGVGVGIGLLWAIDRWGQWRRWIHSLGVPKDGREVDLATMPLRYNHLRVVAVASLGQVAGAMVSTTVGIVIPLMHTLRNPALTPLTQGGIAATTLLGIMVGSVAVGSWSDRRGTLLPFRIAPVLILAGASVVMFGASVGWLVAGLFMMGFGVGGEYSMDGDYISQLLPERWRGMMVGVAKASSSLGNVAAAVVGYLSIRAWSGGEGWYKLMFTIVVLAVIMILSRIRFAQSPAWLLERGRVAEAERAVRRLLGEDVRLGNSIAAAPENDIKKPEFVTMFRGENLRKVLFCGIPWACEGVGVYGIGVFLPLLLMSLGLESDAGSDFASVVRSVELSTWVNASIAVGFAAGLAVVGRWNRVRMQTWGFMLAAAGLALLAAAHVLHLPLWVAVAGFALFEFFLNAGPHLLTYVFPSQVFGVEERGLGAGIAAATGKAGGVAGLFLLPWMVDRLGLFRTLVAVMCVLVLGAAVTRALGHRVMAENKG